MTTGSVAGTLARVGSRLYEVTFEIAPASEAIEDAVAAAFDGVLASHSGVTTVTLTAEGETAIDAARTAANSLRKIGAPPLRVVEDLVGRTEIAERAGVTRQAVGLWVRGERQAISPFPAPYVLVGGGLWLWGEVLPALRARGVDVDDPMEHLTRHDIHLVNGALGARGKSERAEPKARAS